MAEGKIADFKKMSFLIENNADSVIDRNVAGVKIIYSRNNDILIKMGRKNEWLSKDEIYITGYRGEIHIDAPFTSDYTVYVININSRYSDKYSGRRFLIKGNQKIILDNIKEEYERAKVISNPEISLGMIKVLFEQFFLILFRENLRLEKTKRNNKQTKEIVESIIIYFKEHIGENIKFSQIVKKAGLSSTGLKSVFKEHTGMGVMQYYNYMKIEKAKAMLLEGEYNATQIANILGYESIHYFSRQFKDITGESPTQYINSFKQPPIKGKLAVKS